MIPSNANPFTSAMSGYFAAAYLFEMQLRTSYAVGRIMLKANPLVAHKPEPKASDFASTRKAPAKKAAPRPRRAKPTPKAVATTNTKSTEVPAPKPTAKATAKKTPVAPKAKTAAPHTLQKQKTPATKTIAAAKPVAASVTSAAPQKKTRAPSKPPAMPEAAPLKNKAWASPQCANPSTPCQAKAGRRQLQVHSHQTNRKTIARRSRLI